MNVRHDIINNAKSSSSLNKLDNQAVCISLQQNGKERMELVLAFDSQEMALIELNREQAEHLIKMVQELLT
jgi:leucyl-tRNA synthetase